MDLDRLRRTWENWGRKDPMWAILTQPGKEGGRWDEGEFFRTGEADVAWLGSWWDCIASRCRKATPSISAAASAA